MAVLQDVAESAVRWEDVQDCCVWSDGGRHFRSNGGIATTSMTLMQHMCTFSTATAHGHSVDICFGVPAHFKNLCDGSQAHLRHWVGENMVLACCHIFHVSVSHFWSITVSWCCLVFLRKCIQHALKALEPIRRRKQLHAGK